jgi:hypothetical protein
MLRQSLNVVVSRLPSCFKRGVRLAARRYEEGSRLARRTILLAIVAALLFTVGTVNGAGRPAGAGGLTSIDDLNGLSCRGTRAHPGTVSVTYGSGITDVPITLSCVTPVVLNPGAFTVHVTSGTLQVGIFGSQPLPTSGWQFAGTIDSGGHITVPAASVQLTNVPFEVTQDLSGFTAVHLTGNIAFNSNGVAGTLDPESGAMNLSGGISAVVTLNASAPILGQTVTLYSGTCGLGSSSSPIPWTLTSDSPGVAYSQTSGTVTLSSALTLPSLANCSPPMNGLYVFLLDTFAGSGRITFTGSLNPIIVAP